MFDLIICSSIHDKGSKKSFRWTKWIICITRTDKFQTLWEHSLWALIFVECVRVQPNQSLGKPSGVFIANDGFESIRTDKKNFTCGIFLTLFLFFIAFYKSFFSSYWLCRICAGYLFLICTLSYTSIYN